MTRRQWLVIAVLAVADCVVLGGLIAAMTLAPRLLARPTVAPPPAEGAAADQQGTDATLPPTWTPTPPSTPPPLPTHLPTRTPAPTRTPVSIPTFTPASTPTPAPVLLENGDFEEILPDSVPGWEVAAVVNWEPGDEFNPDASYARPEFRPADDPRRAINGSTLQIQTYQWVKFKVTLYQTVEVEPGSRVQFEAMAGGYSSGGGIQVRAGIDPNGGAACEDGSWGDLLVVDQAMGAALLRSPEVVVGSEGLVTVCLFAEPQYAVTHNAAFFDDARLLVAPPD